MGNTFNFCFLPIWDIGARKQKKQEVKKSAMGEKGRVQSNLPTIYVMSIDCNCKRCDLIIRPLMENYYFYHGILIT